VTSRELAGTFGFRGVARAYRHRPPYPDEVFTLLTGLITDGPGTVLDLGAGEGALARPLAARASPPDSTGVIRRVEAVEISPEMVAAGRQRPGGRNPNLAWILGGAETCPLDGPYALVTAGASLHWMSWRPLMNRLVTAMTDRAVLAVVEHGPTGAPWREALTEAIRTHSRSRDYDPAFSLIDALAAEGCFEPLGSATTEPVSFRQSVEDYAEHFFSTASLARELMPPAEADAFAHSVRAIVRPWADPAGFLEMPIVATVNWGRPRRT
jgi:trans-aconitate methyltransferase